MEVFNSDRTVEQPGLDSLILPRTPQAAGSFKIPVLVSVDFGKSMMEHHLRLPIGKNTAGEAREARAATHLVGPLRDVPRESKTREAHSALNVRPPRLASAAARVCRPENLALRTKTQYKTQALLRIPKAITGRGFRAIFQHK
jgi:hypothetical protein